MLGVVQIFAGEDRHATLRHKCDHWKINGIMVATYSGKVPIVRINYVVQNQLPRIELFFFCGRVVLYLFCKGINTRKEPYDH